MHNLYTDLTCSIDHFGSSSVHSEYHAIESNAICTIRSEKFSLSFPLCHFTMNHWTHISEMLLFVLTSSKSMHLIIVIHLSFSGYSPCAFGIRFKLMISFTMYHLTDDKRIFIAVFNSFRQQTWLSFIINELNSFTSRENGIFIQLMKTEIFA